MGKDIEKSSQVSYTFKIFQGKHLMAEEKDTPNKKIYYDQRSVALRTKQSLYFVQEHDKIAMLELLLNDYKEMQVVIVVKNKKKADELSSFLISKKFKVLAIHGNHREVQQKEAVIAFNETTLTIIITTDMILKTLELENINLVISHNLPNTPQDYYNRLALMNEKGAAIMLVSSDDEILLHDIEVNMKVEIEEKMMEGFVNSETPISLGKKNRKKKPRHSKSKDKK
jgi:ATP-dependent RNA helicase RhlE